MITWERPAVSYSSFIFSLRMFGTLSYMTRFLPYFILILNKFQQFRLPRVGCEWASLHAICSWSSPYIEPLFYTPPHSSQAHWTSHRAAYHTWYQYHPRIRPTHTPPTPYHRILYQIITQISHLIGIFGWHVLWEISMLWCNILPWGHYNDLLSS